MPLLVYLNHTVLPMGDISAVETRDLLRPSSYTQVLSIYRHELVHILYKQRYLFRLCSCKYPAAKHYNFYVNAPQSFRARAQEQASKTRNGLNELLKLRPDWTRRSSTPFCD